MASLRDNTPLILYAAPPRDGHLHPALQICTHLASRGYDVTLTANASWEKAITSAQVHYAPMVGLCATLRSGETPPDVYAAIMALPRLQQLVLILGSSFVKLMVSAFDSVRNALVEIKHRVGGIEVVKRRKLIILSDTGFEGTLPLQLGARCLPPGFDQVEMRSVGIGVIPRWWGNKYHPPWGSGLPYDPSEEGIQRNLKVYAEIWEERQKIGHEEKVRYVLDELYGCEKDIDSLFRAHDVDAEDDAARRLLHGVFDATSVCHDVTLQMCMESLEYPVPDEKCIPSHLKFAGPLPLKPLPSNLELPPWWEIVRDNSIQDTSLSSDRKRIVLVTQGTESLDFNEVVIPTIQGLADRNDVIVIAVLCHRGSTLDMPDSASLPSNTFVHEYFPFDAILPHADVFVSSSGYGALTHSIANGVPLIQSGTVIDKPDIGRRVEYSGLGLYLENFPPKPEEVRAAVDEILSNRGGKYKTRALELQYEAQTYRPLQMIEDEILALARK